MRRYRGEKRKESITVRPYNNSLLHPEPHYPSNVANDLPSPCHCWHQCFILTDSLLWDGVVSKEHTESLWGVRSFPRKGPRISLVVQWMLWEFISFCNTHHDNLTCHKYLNLVYFPLGYLVGSTWSQRFGQGPKMVFKIFTIQHIGMYFSKTTVT